MQLQSIISLNNMYCNETLTEPACCGRSEGCIRCWRLPSTTSALHFVAKQTNSAAVQGLYRRPNRRGFGAGLPGEHGPCRSPAKRGHNVDPPGRGSAPEEHGGTHVPPPSGKLAPAESYNCEDQHELTRARLTAARSRAGPGTATRCRRLCVAPPHAPCLHASRSGRWPSCTCCSS